MKDSRGRPDVRSMKNQARRRGDGASYTDRRRDTFAQEVLGDQEEREERWRRFRAAEAAEARESQLERQARQELADAERLIRLHGGEGVSLKVAFRRAALKLHPDQGGSRHGWDRLDRAARLLGLI